MSFEYDDSNLQHLISEMQPKRRLQAMRGGFRKGAKLLRDAVVRELRSSIHSNKDLEKGVRALALKRKAGFRVTVGTKLANKRGKGEAGFHTNRQGLKKPILVWADMGTAERKTKVGKKRGHSTGRMKRYSIIEKGSNAVSDTISEDVSNLITSEIQRVAKKYGSN